MLETKYNHKAVEEGKYENWKKEGYFKSGDTSKKPYSIVIPPPNVTGILHLGHAWDTTLQDIIIRYKRMDGFDALWLPGMDHAGIATQAKVDKKLRDEGFNPRSMDREDWLKKAWAWKEEYANNIHSQWAKLGLSLDYSKERFTLDKGLNDAVNHVFINLYNEGLIYRGKRIINWDPKAMTALSNEEVIYKDIKGAFYHIKYFIEDSSDFLEIATTRPETLFGDTAVAVNPKDDRYKDLIGKNVILPIMGKKIPIVADMHADPEFGTGIVKITPAHDPNDYQVGLRHELEMINVMNPDATMNENAIGYVGLDRFKCREKLVKDLEESNLLIKIEPMIHSVGHSERTDVMVEPYLSRQWFVKMRPLADDVLENQLDKDKKVNFVPKRYEKIMNHWMEITYDWCISRQLWWGHRIPAWYKDDLVKVQVECPGDGWNQDNDVLDTWFSSALWPFSTLGWPKVTDDFNRYFPNDTLVTGYDIIPFWVNRMTFQSLHFNNVRPFKDCLIHGLIRDSEGRKMSKSLGNGIDPMDVIEEYGCDALRFFITTSSAPGTDLRYDEEKVKSTWNFINKFWNASRYVGMKTEDIELDLTELTIYDKWILSKLDKLIKTVRKHMDKYEFNVVGSELYNFIFNDYCSWYIELSKFSDSNTTKSILVYTLKQTLKMLSPFMPFVTDEIYNSITGKPIMISDYPKPLKVNYDTEEMDNIKDFIVKVRNFKLENKITKDIKFNFKGTNKELILNMLRLSTDLESEFESNYIVTSANGEYIISFDFKEEVNVEQLNIDLEKLSNSILRREKLLSNENYVKNAPKNVVDKDRELLEKENKEVEEIKKALNI